QDGTPASTHVLGCSRASAFASVVLRLGGADGLICGLVGRFHKKLNYLRGIVPLDPGVEAPSAMSAVFNERGVFFFLDTHVAPEPDAARIAEATAQAALRLKLFGITPKIAILSHSNFGSHDDASARKMRQVVELLRERLPKVEVEGEMHADTALNPEVRERIFPNSRLSGAANVFVCPNLDAANIAFNMTRVMTDGVVLGPILMGLSRPAHILTPSATVRRVYN